jgi:hypothetical protein
MLISAKWIEGYCNRERRHSTIDSFSSINYDQQFVSGSKRNPAQPRDLSTKSEAPQRTEQKRSSALSLNKP